ncbi:MAG: carboxy terminal-processing peptidase, partial [Candidatus Cloacimonetes bacterium]|nr:carboxy terminal-processing peptidase [Candidatus Cloacimonadota bacterium]
LTDAVNIAGLFFDQGPVVQVKDRVNFHKVYSDQDPKTYFEGPVVVLVNGFSASASEILAAALQDYSRAVIIGSKHTFGKGTVQSLMDLDRALHPRLSEYKPLGSLKLTIQKFYRINGGTTQYLGVEPDIILPDSFTFYDIGERKQDYALPADSIDVLSYPQWKLPNFSIANLKEGSYKRIEDNEKFKFIQNRNEEIKRIRDESKIVLTFESVISDRETSRKYNDDFSNIITPNENYQARQIIYHKSDFPESDADKDKREKWLNDLRKDAYIQEAIEVLKDWKS